MTLHFGTRGFAAIIVLACVARPLAAQNRFIPTFTLGAQSSSATPAITPLTVEPAIWLQMGAAHLWMRGTGEIGGLNSWLRDADAAVSSRIVHLGVAHLSLAGNTEITRPQRTTDQWTRTRIELRAGSSSAAQGIGAGAGLVHSTTPIGQSTSTMASVNAWIRRLGVAVTGQVALSSFASDTGRASANPLSPQGGADTLLSITGPLDAALAGKRLFFSTDARVAVAGQLGEMDYDGTLGAFMFSGMQPHPYGVVTLTRWVAPNAAVTAGFVRRMLDPVKGSAWAGAMFGIRLAYHGRAALPPVHDLPPVLANRIETHRVGDSVVVEIHAPGASSVELEGDPTRWQPRALRRVADGRWQLAVALKPGVYRMNIRVDGGAWMPPPGASRRTDAYEGVVGVVVID